MPFTNRSRCSVGVPRRWSASVHDATGGVRGAPPRCRSNCSSVTPDHSEWSDVSFWNVCPIVESHRNTPSSTSIAATAAVIDLVHDASSHLSVRVTRSRLPTRRRPLAPNATISPSATAAAASAGNRWPRRMRSSSHETSAVSADTPPASSDTKPNSAIVDVHRLRSGGTCDPTKSRLRARWLSRRLPASLLGEHLRSSDGAP